MRYLSLFVLWCVCCASFGAVATIPKIVSTGPTVINPATSAEVAAVVGDAGALTMGAVGNAGSVVLTGSTSGTSTLKVNPIAGTSIFQLPVGNGTSGYFLQTNGSGVTSWASIGAGTGTVTSIATNSGLTGGTITTTGTIGIATGGITNVMVNAAAAIDGTKISPDFGAQSITTLGTITGVNGILTLSTINAAPGDDADLLDANNANGDTVANISVTAAGAGELRVYDGAVARVALQGGTGIITAYGLTLNGSVSGTAAINVPAAAGTGTIFQIPATNGTTGYFLQTNGSGITSWAQPSLSSVTGTLPVANGGTGITSGTSGGILAFTAAGTIASSGALAANAIVIGGGAGVAPSTTTTGTGVLTALGVNTGSAGAFVVFNGAGGTPSSLTLTSATGLPVAGITSSTSTALGVGSLEVGHATDTTITRVSAGKIAVEGVNVVTTSSTDTLTNKTLTSPTLTTPVLGTPTSGALTNCTSVPAAQLTGTLPFSALRSGMVAQVQSTRRDYGADISTTNATFQLVTGGAGDLSVSITPQSASSKIRIRVTGGTAEAAVGRMLATLKVAVGGGADVDLTPASMEGLEGILQGGVDHQPHAIDFIDTSVANTSARVYKVFFASANGVNTVYFHRWSSAYIPVIIVAEEIAP